MSNQEQNRKLQIRHLMDRYQVCDRTIDRWLEEKLLPEPTRINRIRYWNEAEINEFDKNRK
jgi:predicted DNA-binding transcriptional regulator AlpA